MVQALEGMAAGRIKALVALGGNFAVVQSGDEITLDVPNRTLSLHVEETELARR